MKRSATLSVNERSRIKRDSSAVPQNDIFFLLLFLIRVIREIRGCFSLIYGYLMLYNNRIFSFNSERFKCPSSGLIKLGKELQILQPAGMDISPQSINPKIKEMPKTKEKNSQEDAKIRKRKNKGNQLVDHNSQKSGSHP